MKHRCIIALTLFLGLVLAPPLRAQQQTGSVQVLAGTEQPMSTEGVVDIAVRLPKDGVRAGTAFEAFVLVQVAEGWHVNANQPLQPYFIGTALQVEDHEGLRIEEAYYPDPSYRSFGFTSDTLAVYEGEVAIILAARAAPALQLGVHVLQSRLRIQACSDAVCLRPATIAVPIPVDVVE